MESSENVEAPYSFFLLQQGSWNKGFTVLGSSRQRDSWSEAFLSQKGREREAGEEGVINNY